MSAAGLSNWHVRRPGLFNIHFILPYITFCLVTFCLVWFLVKSQTDRQTYRQNTMHMSPPCIRTGGLKKKLNCDLHTVDYWLYNSECSDINITFSFLITTWLFSPTLRALMVPECIRLAISIPPRVRDVALLHTVSNPTWLRWRNRNNRFRCRHRARRYVLWARGATRVQMLTFTNGKIVFCF